MAKNSVQSTESNDADIRAFAKNMQHIAEQSKSVLEAFIARQPHAEPTLMANLHSFSEAASQWLYNWMEDPSRFWETQLDYYEQYVQLIEESSRRMLGEDDVPDEPIADKRFKDAAWEANTVFDFVKDSYLLGAKWLHATTHSVKLDEDHQRRLDFQTQQFIDAISPTNFFLTNPEVLRTTLETNGENLVKGFDNFLRDLEKSRHKLRINSADEGAFEVGKNLAVTPGKVVFQNELLQLIQYKPSTKQVYKTPLLIVSPWINKYYILDLQPHNSFIKWLVGQGHTVFVTSWKNPGSTLRATRFEDYMTKGPLAALERIETITGEKETNVIGYCIAGTLMACTLAYLSAKKKAARVKSITYLTTLIDFADPGDLKLFTNEEHIEAIETIMEEMGFLHGHDMSAIFSVLRANDMIWSTIVNNYMLGKDPLPFDLLYWNADSTNLPEAMHSFYLRNFYLKNNLTKGALTLDGVAIDLSKITTPTYILSTIDDHIAPWKSTYKATQAYGGKVHFTLSGSGHVAGVINPPVRKKYGYWEHASDNPKTADAWFKHATKHDGSWWDDWQAWMQRNKYVADKIPARQIKKKDAIEDAPGSYVKERCE